MSLAAAVALFLSIAAEPTSSGISAHLTFEDAVRIARDRSPDLAIADADVLASRAQLRAAGAIPNPAASFTAGWSSQCADPGCNAPAYSAALGDQGAVARLVSGQRGLAVEAAAQGVRSAETSRLDVQRNLEFEVKRQFVATSVAWRSVGYGEREAARAREAVELARKRFAAGQIRAEDLSRLEMLHLQIEQAVDRSRLAHDQARILLAQLLGLTDEAQTFTVVMGPTKSADPPPRLAAMTLPELFARARERRPDLAAAQAQVEQARARAELARRRVIPQFQLQAQYIQQGSAGGWFTPPTAGFGISVPLPVLYQQQGEIGAADAAVTAAEGYVAKVKARVVAEVATAFVTFQGTQRTARRAEEQLLALSRDVRDTVGAAYEQGNASLLDYLDTQRSRIANELEYLTILQAYWTSVFEVERAVGLAFVP